MGCTPVFSCVVAVVPNFVVLFCEFPTACIALCGYVVIIGIFRGHVNRNWCFESVVNISGFVFQHVYEFFGDVFSLVLLGILYQLRFVDGVVEAFDLIAESARVMFLVLEGA
jgi:hypothetical protein